jgi:hypothetical protein
MNSSLEEKSNEVSIVIYDAPRPPRYLKFNKSFISWMLYGVPLLIGVLIVGTIIFGLSPRTGINFKTPSIELPTSIGNRENSTQMKEAQERVKELEAENQNLQNKLSSAPGEGIDIYFGQINRPYGSQNLIEKGILQLDQIEFIQDGRKTGIKFQLINPRPEHRVSGHIIVFQYSGTETKVYPGVLQNNAIDGIKFSQGESFAVSRLRPTIAEFSGLSASHKMKFVIYIFNREGDLLLKHVTTDFEMTNKAQ